MSLFGFMSKLKSSTSPSAIEHEQLEEACRKGECHVIDVREIHEYAAGHIPGARNHPLSSFDPARLPTDKPVVLVCQAGARSTRALQAAHAAGREDVAHYPPGTGGWKTRGGAVHKL
jgi:rhodanese-related sulfurtransferase